MSGNLHTFYKPSDVKDIMLLEKEQNLNLDYHTNFCTPPQYCVAIDSALLSSQPEENNAISVVPVSCTSNVGERMFARLLTKEEVFERVKLVRKGCGVTVTENDSNEIPDMFNALKELQKVSMKDYLSDSDSSDSPDSSEFESMDDMHNAYKKMWTTVCKNLNLPDNELAGTGWCIFSQLACCVGISFLFLNGNMKELIYDILCFGSFQYDSNTLPAFSNSVDPSIKVKGGVKKAVHELPSYMCQFSCIGGVDSFKRALAQINEVNEGKTELNLFDGFNR